MRVSRAMLMRRPCLGGHCDAHVLSGPNAVHLSSRGECSSIWVSQTHRFLRGGLHFPIASSSFPYRLHSWSIVCVHSAF